MKLGERLSPAKLCSLRKHRPCCSDSGLVRPDGTRTEPLSEASAPAPINSSLSVVQNPECWTEVNFFLILGFPLLILKWSGALYEKPLCVSCMANNQVHTDSVVLVFEILKYFCTFWQIVWANNTSSHLGKYRPLHQSLPRHGQICSPLNWPQGWRPGCVQPPVPEELSTSHRAGGDNDSGFEDPNHAGGTAISPEISAAR